MYEWLFYLLAPAAPVTIYAAPQPEDHVGVVAAQAAYVTLLDTRVEPEPAPTPSRPIDPNCKTCRGKGKVPSGDGQGWTKCPTCQAEAADVAPTPKIPKDTQKQLFRQAPVQSIPPQSNCTDGRCPETSVTTTVMDNHAAPQLSMPGFFTVPSFFGWRRTSRRR
jgi:hypothetical protein